MGGKTLQQQKGITPDSRRFKECLDSVIADGIIEEKYTLIVQINGKLRARIEVNKGMEKEVAYSLAKDVKNVSRFLDTAEPKKVIFVKDRLLNIVI